jgi:2-polyprenyl-3-methyl-5-hydroxy-6-metoxy-1,4-benzoquinol methylase
MSNLLNLSYTSAGSWEKVNKKIMKNWYSLPTYYDVSFSHEMSDELAFLKAIFSQNFKNAHPRLLEPACGTGRLIVPLARSGFICTGFDLNIHALEYLKHKLKRNHLKASIFEGNMADFEINANKFDAAFCTVDTFRHLLTEKQAHQHLKNVAKALKKGGLYILGLHLITDKSPSNKVIRWTNKRGRLTVHTSMSLLEMDRTKRTETLKVILTAETETKKEKFTSIYKLRTYTLKQLNKLLDKVSVFELVNVYDEYYDLNHPVELNSKSEYAVLVLRKK